jgi:signal peptidase II
MYNEGIAFSILSNAGGWQRWFFVTLSSAISIALIIWLRQLDNSKRILSLGIALILAGAIGNLIDRILFGHVIDFIQVYYSAESCLPGFSLYKYTSGAQCFWPAFNIADSAIFLGACLLIADIFMEYKQDKKNA